MGWQLQFQVAIIAKVGQGKPGEPHLVPIV